MNWVIDSDNNPEALEKAMKLYIKMVDANTIITITNEQNGVAIWETSKDSSFSFRSLPMMLDVIALAGLKSITRSSEDKELSSSHRPDSDHYYLTMLAVNGGFHDVTDRLVPHV